jgi:hypothetical protein
MVQGKSRGNFPLDLTLKVNSTGLEKFTWSSFFQSYAQGTRRVLHLPSFPIPIPLPFLWLSYPKNQRGPQYFFSSITLFHLACSLNSSCRISCMLLCGSCILGSHTPISATWLSSVISSWKDIPLLSRNVVARCRIQWVIYGWKLSKKERPSDMVEWGFYSLAKAANGGNIWREKWREKMAGKLHEKKLLRD